MDKVYRDHQKAKQYRTDLGHGRVKLVSKELADALLEEHMAVRQLIQLLGLTAKSGVITLAELHQHADRELEKRERFLENG